MKVTKRNFQSNTYANLHAKNECVKSKGREVEVAVDDQSTTDQHPDITMSLEDTTKSGLMHAATSVDAPQILPSNSEDP